MQVNSQGLNHRSILDTNAAESSYSSSSLSRATLRPYSPAEPVSQKTSRQYSAMHLPHAQSGRTGQSTQGSTGKTSNFRLNHQQQLGLCALISTAVTTAVNWRLGAFTQQTLYAHQFAGEKAQFGSTGFLRGSHSTPVATNATSTNATSIAHNNSLNQNATGPLAEVFSVPNRSDVNFSTNSSALVSDERSHQDAFEAPQQNSTKVGCSVPTGYGGWHEGRYVANLVNESGWTWQLCASECAKSDECEFWTLPISGNYDRCVLVADKGAYHETGFHIEGDKDPNCVNVDEPVVGQEIGSIYYINLEKNKLRRAAMDKQLSMQDIPFHRVQAKAGNASHECSGGIGAAKCKGVAGLALSNLDIIDHGDHSKGFTLVLEDDVFVKDMGILMASVSKVPVDWDIIRWDCIAEDWIPPTFDRINKYVFKTDHARPCEPNADNLWCNFYGGTYAMLWKSSSLDKVRDVWSVEPFSDIDGRLTTNKLNSYCIDVGSTVVVHQPPQQEASDIQLDESGKVNVKWGE